MGKWKLNYWGKVNSELSSAHRIEIVGILRLSIAVCENRWYIEIIIFINSWPWKCRSRSWYTNGSRSGAIRWQIHEFLSNSNSNICPISHRLRYLQKRKNSKLWPWKMKVKLREKKNGIRTQKRTHLKMRNMQCIADLPKNWQMITKW